MDFLYIISVSVIPLLSIFGGQCCFYFSDNILLSGMWSTCGARKHKANIVWRWHHVLDYQHRKPDTPGGTHTLLNRHTVKLFNVTARLFHTKTLSSPVEWRTKITLFKLSLHTVVYSSILLLPIKSISIYIFGLSTLKDLMKPITPFPPKYIHNVKQVHENLTKTRCKYGLNSMLIYWLYGLNKISFSALPSRNRLLLGRTGGTCVWEWVVYLSAPAWPYSG